MCIRDSSYRCKALGFKAERVRDQYERLVGISGTGFFNWNKKQAMFPANTQIKSDAVPLDFSQWKPRSQTPQALEGFLTIKLEVRAIQFERVLDAIDITVL